MNTNQKSKSGWFGNSKRHAVIGRKGGLVTAKRGMSYFQTIGRLGGLKKKKKTV